MTGIEIENFRKSDKELYELKNNNEFLEFLDKKIKEGYNPIYRIEAMQQAIDNIVDFFEFKYPNVFFDSTIESFERTTAHEIAKLLGFKQLIYRLDNYHRLFNVNLKGHSKITKKYKTKLYELKYELVNFDENGHIISSLEHLKGYGFIKHTENIENIYQFTEQLIREGDVDVSELKQVIFQYETSLELRNKILNLAALKILYSKNTLPIYGYPRAKSFIRMCNKELSLNLKTDLIDEIMSIDYSIENQKTITLSTN